MAEKDENNVFLENSVPHLAVSAIQANEIFLQLKSSGFSKNEALYITAFIFSGMIASYDDFEAPDDDFDDEDYGDENGDPTPF